MAPTISPARRRVRDRRFLRLTAMLPVCLQSVIETMIVTVEFGWRHVMFLLTVLVMVMVLLMLIWIPEHSKDSVYYQAGSLFLDLGNIRLQPASTAAGIPQKLPAVPQSLRVTDTSLKSPLRFDWTNLELHSILAKRMAQHQTNCALPLANFTYRNRYGLGSDLHVWTQALCNAMETGVRVRTEHPWTFLDQGVCGTSKQSSLSSSSSSMLLKNSAMTCYFPQSELLCPADRVPDIDPTIQHVLYKNKGMVGRVCGNVLASGNWTLSDVRAAGMEFLFAHLSPAVVAEAERQYHRVFRKRGKRTRSSQPPPTPDELIAVHIRWGDKKREMKLVSMEQYVQAVEQLVQEQRQRRRQQKSGEPPQRQQSSAHIFLATEDPRAVAAFQTAAKDRNWTVYVDPYFEEFLPHRNPAYNGNPKMAEQLQGRPGLVALASLVLAMQANNFVLTTASNWSRIMNELRKNILDPRCGKCTKMIDLRQGEW